VHTEKQRTGFERRLLATVRGTVATAVAFPQKSESVLSHQQKAKRKLGFLFCTKRGGFEQVVRREAGQKQFGELFLDRGSRIRPLPPVETASKEAVFVLIIYSA